MTKIYVGDKVRIKKNLNEEDHGGLYGVVAPMADLRGRVARIKQIGICEDFKLDIGLGYTWSSHMFDKIKKEDRCTKRTKSQIGASNRRKGSAFEMLVRKDLGSMGLIVTKFQGNVGFKLNPKHDLNNITKQILLIDHLKNNPEKLQIVPAKASRFRLSTTGLPDFIAFFPRNHKTCWFLGKIEPEHQISRGDIIGIEAKTNGYLDKVERAKLTFMLDNHIFDKIFIAKQVKEGRKNKVEYRLFERD